MTTTRFEQCLRARFVGSNAVDANEILNRPLRKQFPPTKRAVSMTDDDDDDEVLLMAALKLLSFPPKQKNGNKQIR